MSTPEHVTAIPATMHAVTQDGYGDSGVLRWRETATPTPRADEVLIAVEAAAVDRGTWHVMTGLPLFARLGLGLRRPKAPIAGLDTAGTVVAVGSKVTRFAVGDEVCGIARGSFAPWAAAREAKLVAAPTSVDAVQAAALGVSGITAVQAVRAARVPDGGRVLVTGASGGVGSYVVQVAAARGLRVVAVCSAPKVEAVRSWGAERVVARDVHRDTRALLATAAGGESFDAVIDIAGHMPVRELRRVVTPRGSIVFVGGETEGRLMGGFHRPMLRSIRMVVARQRYVMLVSSERAEDLQTLVDLVDAGAVRPHVHAVRPVEAAGAAVDELAAGQVVGKLVLQVASTGPSAAGPAGIHAAVTDPPRP
ncbi:NAD(P)-dependent alcohol dehydrogenase [Nocardioides sp. R-C-SC26]|uniref:NAD(P)-dependent alcohol dehydrogenase n=1 Tax=Nocardioides sp. R-C-SC26 TaxID=2870414 RepID=UPI001E4E2D82|nr:NAD(P)-dependent alcohol dehydrogenase [Nocardioides sp. R-C-SC26]